MSRELAAYRAAIEALDDEFVDLLARRAALVRTIWAYKTLHGLTRIDVDREADEIARLLERAEARGLSAERLADVLRTIIGHDLLAQPKATDNG